jgi:hypothetical protein
MTETKEDQIVDVMCMGISERQGFSLAPVGYEPIYLEFHPGQPTKMRRPYADFLVAQDPHKFNIVDDGKPTAAARPGKTK